ncbi:MAG: hypothetical protein KIS73_00410 [Enhydrobacter sp.]|nr:hypothetical protein [Enhydrobacter sp.]
MQFVRCLRMTQRPWTHLVNEPAARHLVAVRLAPKAADEPAALLTTLIEGLCPNADFALLTRCEEECAVTFCAFATPRDAEQLASAVGAEETEDYPEWASQRCFTLDEPTVQAITEAIEANVYSGGMPQQHRPTDVLTVQH